MKTIFSFESHCFDLNYVPPLGAVITVGLLPPPSLPTLHHMMEKTLSSPPLPPPPRRFGLFKHPHLLGEMEPLISTT